jgi:chaperonin GroEL
METTTDNKPKGLIYGLEDRPPLRATLFAAVQHLLAVFVAIITPPLIIAGALKLDLETTGFLVSMALFVSGVATITVGGITEAEQWERKMRVEDAVNAARAAFEEGVVAGGGSALIALVPALEELADSLEGDERTGVAIAIAACKAPVERIAENAGTNGRVVVEKLSQMPPRTGFDASKDAYVDMFDAGIIDPVRVTRSALEAAFSVAETLLVTEATVTPVKGEAPSLAEAFHVGGAR